MNMVKPVLPRQTVGLNSDAVEFDRLVREHGALVNLPLAGILLGVSRVQIYRLWRVGHFHRIQVKGFRYVPFREVMAYARAREGGKGAG